MKEFLIVTVCLNGEQTIRDTLDSVDCQRGVTISHVVKDGASKDRTGEILSEKMHAHRLVVSCPDTGIYDAFNQALKLGVGKYIGFLNSDDCFGDVDLLAKVKAKFESCDLDVVMIPCRMIRDGVSIRYFDPGRFSRWGLETGWMPPHPGVFFKASCLDSVGDFDNRLAISGDYDFLFRLFSIPHLKVDTLENAEIVMLGGGASNGSVSKLIKCFIEDWRILRKRAKFPLIALIGKKFRKLRTVVG